MLESPSASLPCGYVSEVGISVHSLSPEPVLAPGPPGLRLVSISAWEYKFRWKGSSGMADQMPDVETLKSFNAGLVEEFRANGGKVRGKYQRVNLLLLTTTGAKTGQPRVTPLAYFRFDSKLIIIGSSW